MFVSAAVLQKVQHNLPVTLYFYTVGLPLCPKSSIKIQNLDFVGIQIINRNIRSPLCTSEKTCSSVSLNECV